MTIDLMHIENLGKLFVFILGFIIIAVSGNHISRLVLRLKLPLITGFMIFGILAGPFGLHLLTKSAVDELFFINETSLAFIAFAAGTELYIKELRKSFSSIIWNTFGQFIISFVLGSILVYLISGYIPFMAGLSQSGKIAVAILTATIFVARSPSSAIAIIDEMKAKGSFTQMAIGVTVIKDVLVVVLFAICFSLSISVIHGENIGWLSFIILLAELVTSFVVGYLAGRFFSILLRLNIHVLIKTIVIVLTGYLVYVLSNEVLHFSEVLWGFEFHFEPILSCITASFFVINFSKERFQFQRIIQDTVPYIYVAFFVLTGAMISIDFLIKAWFVAVLLFFIRLLGLITGAYFGSTLAGDPKIFRKIGWMPFVTQAGVSLALITEIADEFAGWGHEFATILVAVIVINQILGPPLFKWAINKVGESNLKPKIKESLKIHSAIIFGLDYQSIALARELRKHQWNIKIITTRTYTDEFETNDFEVMLVNNFEKESILDLKLDSAHAAILMLTDAENYGLCLQVYKHLKVKEIIVRLQKHNYMNKFRKLGVTVIEPATAVVSLIDHFVRAPLGTSILLGMESNYDTIDIEVRDRKLHGTSLRDLRLPADVLILSVNRNGQSLVSHGYTRLRSGDIVTLFGSPESLEKVHLRFEIK